MRVLTADDTGLIKVVEMRERRVVARFGSQAMSQGIDGMAWAGGADDAEAGVLVSRRGGDVDLCSTMDGKSSSLLSLGPGSGGFAGVGVVGSGERGVVCTRKGSMSIFPLQSSGTAGPVSFTVGKSCRAMRVRSGVAATGGQEELLKVWDLDTQKASFKSRNERNDMLDLRRPVNISGIAFAPDTDAHLYTVTSNRELRLYDTKAGQRAMWEFKDASSHPLTCVLPLSGGNYLVIGDGAGNTYQFDVRMKRRMGKFKGVAGGITSIVQHPQLPLVATTSLDRFVRVYSLGTRKLVKRVYLKQKLTAALFSSYVDAADDADERGDNLWTMLNKRAAGGKKTADVQKTADSRVAKKRRAPGDGAESSDRARKGKKKAKQKKT